MGGEKMLAKCSLILLVFNRGVNHKEKGVGLDLPNCPLSHEACLGSILEIPKLKPQVITLYAANTRSV